MNNCILIFGYIGYGGGFNEREGVEYVHREDSDDEYDEVVKKSKHKLSLIHLNTTNFFFTLSLMMQLTLTLSILIIQYYTANNTNNTNQCPKLTSLCWHQLATRQKFSVAR